MNVTRAIVLSMGIVVGILLLALVDRIGIFARGSNPGPGDSASRGGAEIVLEMRDRACVLIDKTRKVKVRKGYRVTWNIANKCDSSKSAEIQFPGFGTPQNPLPVSGSLSAPSIPANSPGAIVATAEREGTYEFVVLIDGIVQSDPDLIIDRF
jgi:hypothetical protein